MQSLTRDQVRRVDQIAIRDFAIPGVVLMENAGRASAEAILQLLTNKQCTTKGRNAVILCGGGNNGGDGYVIARHLQIAGVAVRIVSVVEASKLAGDAAINRAIIDRIIEAEPQGSLSLKTLTAEPTPDVMEDWAQADVIVDALLGTGFSGPLRPQMAAVIKAANEARVPIVAIDLPSGLDCDTGVPAAETIRAVLTVTFVAPKTGFAAAQAVEYLGNVVVAGIGAPEAAVQRAIAGK